MTTLTIDTDEELVSRYAEGEREAFDELVLRYSDDISRFTTWMVHDPPAAEEITQTTFLRTQVALDRKRLPRATWVPQAEPEGGWQPGELPGEPPQIEMVEMELKGEKPNRPAPPSSGDDAP